MDLQNESIFLRISYTIPASLVTNNNQCLGTIVFNNAARKNYRHNDAIEDEFRTMFGNADLKPETYW
jgi:hypothetical protein